MSEEEIEKLYQEYVKALDKKLETIMWVVLDWGHKIMMVPKQEHYAMVWRLLRSGDHVKIMVAVEVMGRTTGNWK